MQPEGPACLQLAGLGHLEELLPVTTDGPAALALRAS